jgi:hypothetical protein
MRPASWLAFAASLAGSVLLAGAHDLLQAPLVPLAELALHEGAEVRVQATVARSTPLALGGQVAQLADATGRAAAWLPEARPLDTARVEAQGIVERGRLGLELRAARVALLRPPDAPVPVGELARVAPALAGQAVVAAGTLRAPRSGGWALAEGDAAVPLLGVKDWEGQALLGQAVEARGVLTYDAEKARYTLEASEVRSA